MKKTTFSLVLASLALLLTLSGCTDNGTTTQTSTAVQEEPAQALAPATEEKTPQPAAEQEAALSQPAPTGNPVVMLKTSKGDIAIELWPDKAPATVENFLTYVRSGFYDGTIFHRVISGFMIQGGGLTPDMSEKTTKAPIKNEAKADLPNNRGTIAMARRPHPDSATSQFFINHTDNAMLNYRGPSNPGYAVFGKVIEGMETVDAIAAAATTTRAGHQNVPIDPILIETAVIANP